jgi:hypothetical protein
MSVTPRYLVHLSSAEIAFLHALVQRQVRGLVAERPEGRGTGLAAASPELLSLDRRLLARLREVSDDEEAYFGARRIRPEAARIGEEQAALAEVAARNAGACLQGWSASFREAGCDTRQGHCNPAGRGSNVTLLHEAGQRPRVRVG